MKPTTSAELRSLFLKFFQDKGHAVISSASLIPENDPTVLFTTAGMHPLVPYLLGAKHPAGTRLTDVQKCVRTGDIDDVGDFSHLTFFEMLGNWSLGDYFKKEMIPWSWEFLTSPEYLGLPKEKLAFSVFAGDADCTGENFATVTPATLATVRLTLPACVAKVAGVAVATLPTCFSRSLDSRLMAPPQAAPDSP